MPAGVGCAGLVSVVSWTGWQGIDHRGSAGLEAGDDGRRQLAAQQALDVPQQGPLLGADQGNGLTAGSGPPGAPDAVYIILRDIRQLMVDDIGQLVDVDPAGGDVRGHQETDGAAFEIGKRLGARPLGLVAMDGVSGNAGIGQLLGQTIGAMLGAGEDQHLVPVARRDQMSDERTLA